MIEILKYNPKLKERARELRKNSTLYEILLWNKLKQRKILGYQFQRQKPIRNYIVDFYNKSLKLVIEVDGKIHWSQRQEDIFRQQEIESLGITFLRFSNDDIDKNLEMVLDTICKKVLELKSL